jgi:hypothetical protein
MDFSDGATRSSQAARGLARIQSGFRGALSKSLRMWTDLSQHQTFTVRSVGDLRSQIGMRAASLTETGAP